VRTAAGGGQSGPPDNGPEGVRGGVAPAEPPARTGTIPAGEFNMSREVGVCVALSRPSIGRPPSSFNVTHTMSLFALHDATDKLFNAIASARAERHNKTEPPRNGY
jgi:hypothetical protein